MLPIKIRFLST